ncbi:hypothetical protein N7540_008365 [Penicillium herquei]|nr:hypothetical protein N7540_008365 [Penicillium herquei]
MGWRDDWPSMPDGSAYDGKQLVTLFREGKSPFRALWDVNLLIEEIEKHTGTQVVDIPVVDKGSNNYVTRSDVNMPEFDGFPIEVQAPEAIFEAAVYNLLQTESDIHTSHLLYYSVPVLHPGPKNSIPKDLAGRRLFLFEKAEGVDNVWNELNAANKV